MSRKPSDEEGFLSRWSRRKQAVREGVEEAPVLETAEPLAELDEAETVDPELAANRAAAEAVDLDSLTAQSDLSVFMKRGVPKALKSAALRKLWSTDPVFAVLDGLNDYDEDFRVADTVVSQFQSAWEVGKGYKAKAEEMAAEAERLERDGSGETDLADGSDIEPEGAGKTPVEALETGSMVRGAEVNVSSLGTSGNGEDAAMPVAQDEEDQETVRKVPIRRRMAVTFDD